MCLRKDSVSDLLRFCGEDLEDNKLEIVIGIQIGNKLNFESHMKSLCSKFFPKVGALQRISNLLHTQRKNLLFNSIITFQFSYCKAGWPILLLRRSDSLLNNALRIV